MAKSHVTASANAAPPPISAGCDGFVVADVDLPAERTDIPCEARERAAELVTGIACGCMPEELVDGVPARVRRLHAEPLQRCEALAHLNLLLEVLAPRAEQA